MQNILFILNKGPYGQEESYNAIRLANAILKDKEAKVRIFLLGDAASCAKKGQQVPAGYYNMEVMLKNALREGAEIDVCGTCMDARGIMESEIVEGANKSTMPSLAEWTLASDKTLVF